MGSSVTIPSSGAGRLRVADDASLVARWIQDEDIADALANFPLGTAIYDNRKAGGVAAPLTCTATNTHIPVAGPFGGDSRALRMTDPNSGLVGADAIDLPPAFTASLFFRPTTASNLLAVGFPTLLGRSRVANPAQPAGSGDMTDWSFLLSARFNGSVDLTNALNSLSITAYLRTSTTFYRIDNDAQNSGASGGAYSAHFGVWNFIAARYDGANFSLTVNDATISIAATGTPVVTPSTSRWVLGQAAFPLVAGKSRAWPGETSDVRVYSEAKSNGFLRALARSGR